MNFGWLLVISGFSAESHNVDSVSEERQRLFGEQKNKIRYELAGEVLTKNQTLLERAFLQKEVRWCTIVGQ